MVFTSRAWLIGKIRLYRPHIFVNAFLYAPKQIFNKIYAATATVFYVFCVAAIFAGMRKIFSAPYKHQITPLKHQQHNTLIQILKIQSRAARKPTAEHTRSEMRAVSTFQPSIKAHHPSKILQHEFLSG
ncbi:hypothetical protein [Rivihabitans pingtungensis]|uniref:hypothetical protein n=1 Tax=Rivihabitans pingtungensis TaxID=1054498 RepID=UPI001304CE1B|nr:hypothetical protein [Rivihabitans pingtungensis]